MPRLIIILIFRHTRRGVFANAMVMQSWSHLPYTMAQRLYGDYVVYSNTDAKSDGQNLMVVGSVGKTLDFMLNQRTYNYTTYSQLSSCESQRWLRGRELLFTISIRK